MSQPTLSIVLGLEAVTPMYIRVGHYLDGFKFPIYRGKVVEDDKQKRELMTEGNGIRMKIYDDYFELAKIAWELQDFTTIERTGNIG